MSCKEHASQCQAAVPFDGDKNFAWVQWRNELRVEYQYEDLVEADSGLFGQIPIPFIRRADFSLIYRGRFDPVYIVRDKYDNLYYDDQTKRLAIPENDIREINLDVDFGQVFGHKLSMRLGKQQIVWSESDLFRSIDIVNPLRIDQNGFVGEAKAFPWMPITRYDQWFITGQHLLTYNNDNRPTALNPFTNAPSDRMQRWEQLFTLSGSGLLCQGQIGALTCLRLLTECEAAPDPPSNLVAWTLLPQA